MNHINYQSFIVSEKHSWIDGLIIEKIYVNNWQKWGMHISHNKYSNNFNYLEVGYTLLDLNYKVNYKSSKDAPWVNKDWLPFWSEVNINKSKILISLELYFYKNKYNIITNIFNKTKLPFDILKVIFSFTKIQNIFYLLKKINNDFFKNYNSIKKLSYLLHH